MKISDVGLSLIKKWEGCVLSAYQDISGVWTIGYGHTAGVVKGMAITESQAEEYLKADIASAEECVNGYMRDYDWNQNEFDALVSFAYNIGSINNLTAYGTRSRVEIAAAMLLYCNAGGTFIQGLYDRRMEEHQLFLTPIASNVPLDYYVIGSTYTLDANMNVRVEPSTKAALVGYENLTEDGKKHDIDKNGALERGTRVTCLNYASSDNEIWLLIPSGWVCAYKDGVQYIV